MAADAGATVAALDDARAVFRQRIEASAGRVIDMAGDSVLAVFDTAAGAVDAALAVQKALEAASASIAEDKRMRVRIGVHLGDVMEKPDGTVYGDGVNIAARLESLAEPGGTVVSESIQTAQDNRPANEFEDMGEHAGKNIAHPVRAYRGRIHGAVGGAGATPEKRDAPPLALSDRPSIAVAPVSNMSGDPNNEA